MRSGVVRRTLALTVLMALPESAQAFCRATTCDPAVQSCAEDANDCARNGAPVYWKSDCVSVSVQADGAPKAGIDYAAARAAVERAFAAWMNVTCPGGGHPSFRVEITDPVVCSRAEYNREKRNANIVMFRDDSWPYAGASQDVLGYTRINFDTNTGELYDVDIELNAVTEPLAVGRPPKSNEADLDSILTHEVGHFLGLNHSKNVEATMVAGYQAGSIELRTPGADDIAGICAIYPPDRVVESNDCAPRRGFSELCGAEQSAPPLDEPTMPGDQSPDHAGCALAAAGANRSRFAPLVLLGALALFRRRARAASR